MKSFFIVSGALVLGAAIIAGVMWFGVSNFGKWSAEFGPELTVDLKVRAKEAESRLAKAEDAYGRWVALGDVALWKAQAPTTDDAKAAAIELLGLAEGYKTDWNYGNAIHKANSSLGRIALVQGDRLAARGHLLASVKSDGSPQMNSFGPNMIFAKEMLDAGEKEAVLDYLQLCAKFWTMEDGRLAVWKNAIIDGRMPKFGANLLF